MESKFSVYFNGNLFSNSQKAITLSNLKKFGEIKEGKVIYSGFEAVFLAENGKAEIFRKNKAVSKEDLINIFLRKDKDFLVKYKAFRELRKKGYIVKEGLKFGGEFRVYRNSEKHAKWIVYAVKNQKIDLKDLIAKIRISHSTGKKLLLGILDSEDDVLFYEIDWKKI